MLERRGQRWLLSKRIQLQELKNSEEWVSLDCITSTITVYPSGTQAHFKMEHLEPTYDDDDGFLDDWNTPEFAELFAKFHDLMIRAEDAEEKEAVIRKTEEMKRKRQFHPCRSAKEEFEDGSSCCSTPNGIYHGSVGSDAVFRTESEQEAYYEKPAWYRFLPCGPKDLNEDQFYIGKLLN